MDSMTNVDEIVAAALRLDPSNRRAVVTRIKESLGEMSEAEVEALWLEEATQRAREAREGLVEDIPLEQALRDARTQLD
jgi:Putative addiction module component